MVYLVNDRIDISIPAHILRLFSSPRRHSFVKAALLPTPFRDHPCHPSSPPCCGLSLSCSCAADRVSCPPQDSGSRHLLRLPFKPSPQALTTRQVPVDLHRGPVILCHFHQCIMMITMLPKILLPTAPFPADLPRCRCYQ